VVGTTRATARRHYRADRGDSGPAKQIGNPEAGAAVNLAAAVFSVNGDATRKVVEKNPSPAPARAKNNESLG
jgi:hypothetical protein